MELIGEETFPKLKVKAKIIGKPSGPTLPIQSNPEEELEKDWYGQTKMGALITVYGIYHWKEYPHH